MQCAQPGDENFQCGIHPIDVSQLHDICFAGIQSHSVLTIDSALDAMRYVRVRFRDINESKDPDHENCI